MKQAPLRIIEKRQNRITLIMLSIADSPLARSTEVIRLIGTYGPIKLRDLEAHVSFSRSALHRICAQLEALNLARRRVSRIKPMFSHMPLMIFLPQRNFQPLKWTKSSPFWPWRRQRGAMTSRSPCSKARHISQMSTAPNRQPTGPPNTRCFPQMQQSLRCR